MAEITNTLDLINKKYVIELLSLLELTQQSLFFKGKIPNTRLLAGFLTPL